MASFTPRLPIFFFIPRFIQDSYDRPTPSQPIAYHVKKERKMVNLKTIILDDFSELGLFIAIHVQWEWFNM